MNAITRMSSNAPWEPIAGYSRLVRAGDFVAVSGTTATDERGLLLGAGQMYVQARQALNNIRTALERAGLTLESVIRTRMFVTDIGRFAEAARAHQEFFGAFPPASSMLEIRRLVNPEMLIEIEADAYAGPPQSERAGQKRTARATKPSRSAAAKKAPKKKPAPRKSSRKK